MWVGLVGLVVGNTHWHCSDECAVNEPSLGRSATLTPTLWECKVHFQPVVFGGVKGCWCAFALTDQRIRGIQGQHRSCWSERGEVAGDQVGRGPEGGDQLGPLSAVNEFGTSLDWGKVLRPASPSYMSLNIRENPKRMWCK